MDSDKTKLEIMDKEDLNQIIGGSAGSPEQNPNFVGPPNLAPPPPPQPPSETPMFPSQRRSTQTIINCLFE